MREFLSLIRLLAPYRLGIAIALVFSFLTVGSNIGLMAASAVLISCAALHPPVLDLMTLIVGVRFFGISRAVFRYLERYFSHDVTFRILKALRVDLYKKLEPKAPACLEKYRSGDLLGRLVFEVETLKDFYLRVLAPPLTALLVLGGAFAFLSVFDLKFALVLLVFFLLAGVVLPLAMRKLGRGIRLEMLKVKADLSARLVDSIQGMTEIIVYEQKEEQLHQSALLDRKLAALQSRLAGLSGFTQAGTQLATNLAFWCVLVLAVPMVQSGRLDGIYLAMIPLFVSSSFEAVHALPLMFSYWEESRAAWKRLQEVTEDETQSKDQDQNKRPDKIQRKRNKWKEKKTIKINRNREKSKSSVQAANNFIVRPSDYSLEIKDLWFRYSPDEPWVLTGLNLWVPHGGKAALIGPSGAGKSTVISLLLRFYDYQRGSIRIGGRELKDYRPEDVRSFFGVVAQDTHLFNTTIRENLLLADPKAREDEVWEAARKANIHDFIQSLPQGYDTYIGEGGFKLSGGQRQRLALARALLKKAPVLVLDEATANLDALAEKEVLDSLLPLLEGRTVLAVTHRPALLEKMDQAVRISNF